MCYLSGPEHDWGVSREVWKEFFLEFYIVESCVWRWFNKIFPCDFICHLVAGVVALLVLSAGWEGSPSSWPPRSAVLGSCCGRAGVGPGRPRAELRGFFRPSEGASRGAAPPGSARASVNQGACSFPELGLRWSNVCAGLVRAELKSLSPPFLTRSPSATEQGTVPGTSSRARGSFPPHLSSRQRASLQRERRD